MGLMFILTGRQKIGLAANQTMPTQVTKWYIRTPCIKQIGTQLPFPAVMRRGAIWVAATRNLAQAAVLQAHPVLHRVPRVVAQVQVAHRQAPAVLRALVALRPALAVPVALQPAPAAALQVRAVLVQALAAQALLVELAALCVTGTDGYCQFVKTPTMVGVMRITKLVSDEVRVRTLLINQVVTES
jgi:hypothetical protein